MRICAALIAFSLGLAAVASPSARWNGADVPLEKCRVSAMPFNRIWPGYQRPLDQTKPAAFVSFEVAKPGVFALTLPTDAKSVRVRPFRRDQGQVSAGVFTTRVTHAEQFVVEVDGFECHVFADKPWTYEPRPGDRYFGPGEHDAGLILPHSGERVVLDRGARVYGNILLLGVSDVTVEGRGILDTSRLRRADAASAGYRAIQAYAKADPVWGTTPVFAHGCRRIRVSGLVFLDSPRWTMNLDACDDLLIEGVKLVGMWRYNSDGIDICDSRRVIVRNSFVRAFDDCVIARPPVFNEIGGGMRDMVVSNCVLWCDWDVNMKVQHGQFPSVMEDIHFRDIDCVNVSEAAIWFTTRWGSTNSVIRNVSFDDIRLDIQPERLRHEFQGSDETRFGAKSADSVLLAKVDAYSLGKVAENQGTPGKMDLSVLRILYSDVAFRNFAIYDGPGHRLMTPSDRFSTRLYLCATTQARHAIRNVTLENLPPGTQVAKRGDVSNVVRR